MERDFSGFFLSLAAGSEARADEFCDAHMYSMLLDNEIKNLREAVSSALREMRVAGTELSWDAATVELGFAAYGRAVGRLYKLAQEEGLLPSEEPKRRHLSVVR